jgi:hypothetical protein
MAYGCFSTRVKWTWCTAVGGGYRTKSSAPVIAAANDRDPKQPRRAGGQAEYLLESDDGCRPDQGSGSVTDE